MHLKTLLLIAGLTIYTQLQAEIVTEELTYKQGDTVMKGLFAYDDTVKGPRPGILVVHEWWGHNDYARKRAMMLAELGYTALAVDMYGDGKTADHPDDAMKFSKAVGGNLALAKQRFTAAIDTLKQKPQVDTDNLAAIGYCFGGGIVLQMARQGIKLDGVVSFHGSLVTETPVSKGSVNSKIMVFNGAADPFVKTEHITAFKTEMENAEVDYRLINYPQAKHSFTNPEADIFGEKFNLPLAYDKQADEKSWLAMQQFFDRIFDKQ